MLDLQQWWFKYKIIAECSVNHAAEGKHYSSAIRLHKQSPTANLPVDVREKVKHIRLHPPPYSLSDILSTSQWEVIKKNLLNTSGTMKKWILQYITDVSALLSQITDYREKNRVTLTSST